MVSVDSMMHFLSFMRINSFYFLFIVYYLILDGGEKQLIDVHNKSADDILSLLDVAAAATER